MKLASIFTDRMVIQANMPIRIFGEGKGTVKVSFLGETAELTSNEESWCVTLPKKPYGGPYEMKINLDGEEITLEDIYVGEVWIAGGQSNMELLLYQTEYGFSEAEHSYNDKIRFFTVPKRLERNTVFAYPDTPWQICEEETALRFTAIGYYVAKELQKKLGVHVGIISCNWGSKKIETFIKREYFNECPALKDKLSEYNKLLEKLDLNKYKEDFDNYLKAKEKYNSLIDFDKLERTRERGVRACVGEPIDTSAPSVPLGPYSPVIPGALYDTMVSRIVPYGVKGFLWYQGESNGADMDYLEKYLVLMKCMRDSFQNPDMPFYAIELASFSCYWDSCYQETDDRFVTKNSWAFLREQQQKATEIGENNYLVTSMELGDIYDIHPIQKKELSHRMSMKILKHTYGFDIYADQPLYKSVEFKDGKAYIKFDNADGLYCRCKDGVKMYVSDESHILKRGIIDIKDDMVIVYSEEVKNPTVVRYGFDSYYCGRHIYNKSGLPVAPFRTDK